MWVCKTCNKKFVPELGVPKSAAKKAEPVKKAVGKPTIVAKKKPVAETKAKGSTEIIVNNNTIKTVPGLLTLDQAFDMVSSYFKEIAKEKAEITERNDKKTIKFKVTAGGKN